jgi:competence protein ComEC
MAEFSGSGREIVLFSDRAFDPGTECELGITFLKSRKTLNPGEQSRNDICANLSEIYDLGEKRMSLYSKIQEYRYRINRYIEENFEKESGAFVASVTTGQATNLNEELREAFNATGLAHILSISGTHFGLFSVLLFGMFRAAIKAFPYRVLQRLTIYLTPSQAAAVLCLPFMLAYLGLSGASIPAIRSFIMISLFLSGLIVGRKGYWLNSVLFAAFILAIWEPEYMFSLSFQLSFLAVLCIGFSVQNEDEKKEGGKIIRYVKNALLMTLSASVGTAPLVAYYFHYFSVISPLSNLLIAPLIGFLLIPIAVLSCFLFLVTGHFIFTPIVSALSEMSISSVRLLSTVPHASVNIPAFPMIILLLFYAGLVFYFIFHKKKYLLFVPFVPVVIYLVLSISEKNDLGVTFLDVGQGDSSVIELPDGKTMMIDTGKTGRETASFLKYRGNNAIDFLALSHVHPDHTGGLENIAKRFHVKEILDNGRIILPDEFNSMRRSSLNRGALIEGKGYGIYVLHPYAEFYTMQGNEYNAANNDSLVLKIEGDHASFLFTGDIEEEAEENILHLGNWIKSDVIKVPHHGGKTSAYEPFLKAVNPDIAVISAGRDNAFGHPHQETMDALSGVRVFRTDTDGAIKIKETARGLEIKTFRDSQFEKAGSLHDEMKNLKRLFDTW